MRPLLPLALTLTAALAGCGTPPPERIALPRVTSEAKVRVPYRTIELRQISLPTYAAQEEIFAETPAGVLTGDPALLWADDPARSLTMAVSRNLGQITGAQVAAEPWPFADPAAVTVEIRLDSMVAGADGQYRLAGQYFVAPYDIGPRPRSGDFQLQRPYDPALGARGAAAALGALSSDLAELIAREGF